MERGSHRAYKSEKKNQIIPNMIVCLEDQTELSKRVSVEAEEMAIELKALASLVEGSSSVPSIHMAAYNHQ